MEDLITHAHALFQANASPPLPPAPAGEPVPVLVYGSSHTQVREMPPPPPPRSPSPSMRAGQSSSSVPPSPTRTSNGNSGRYAQPPSDDFSPQLPLRPANSIHPSLRAGPMSGQSVRQSLPPPARSAQFFDDNISYAHLTPAPNAIPASIPPVPPSPSKRGSRIAPSPLPLKSPWSDSQPSLISTPSNLSSSSLGDAEGQEVIFPSDAIASASAPSSGTSFASAISPTTSFSSQGAAQPLITPPMPPKPLTPSGSPNRSSTATVTGPTLPLNHAKASSE